MAPGPGGACVFALALVVLLACAGTLHAVSLPEFEGGYTRPAAAAPAPRAGWHEYLDVAVLLAALSLASYLALRARSRRALFLLSVLSLLYFGFWRRGCVCPVGAIQNVALALSPGGYAVPWIVLVFFAAPLAFALAFGRTFCAAVCPLGAIQDVVLVRPVKVAAPIAFLLGLLPYAFLGLTVLLAVTGVAFLTCRLDPFVGFFRLSASWPMLTFGGVLLALGTVIGRPYCRFLCPYGVLLGWCSRLAWRHVSITPDACVQCRLCEEACPFGAIRKPTPAPSPEPRAKGVRRLALILVLSPLFVVLGGWIGSRLDTALSQGALRVRIAERIVREDLGLVAGDTLESESFRSTGETVPDLIAQTLAVRRTLRRGGWLFGAFLALSFCGRLVHISLHRTEPDYKADRSLCMSCARCFLSCPKERDRLKKRGDPA